MTKAKSKPDRLLPDTPQDDASHGDAAIEVQTTPLEEPLTSPVYPAVEDQLQESPAPQPPALELQPALRVLDVHRALRGALTYEKVILPGRYREDDARLLGLADYLVRHGYAEWAD